VRDGGIIPRFLGAGDTPWLRLLIDEVERMTGRREAELDERLRSLHVDGVDDRTLRLAATVLRRTLSTTARCSIDPRKARAALFVAAAGMDAPRDAVLRRVASELETTVDALEQALFGDVPGQRILTLRGAVLSPTELALRANLALARGFLERACVVSISLEGNARAIVRQAKLRRLICGVRPAPVADGAILDISGPFALFRHTLVYGRALGELVPLLAWCRRFRLEATCVLPGGALTLRLATGDPIFPSAEPRRFDSKVEERFFRDFTRLAPAWDVLREPEPVQAGPWLLFPDFALRHRRDPGRRWLLEIVGFWTERYLERKLASYRAARIDNLILCIADDLVCNEASFPPGARVLRYRRAVAAASVLEIVERHQPPAAPGSRVTVRAP
jgi:predicted nuclease of restriction endonuclease-like RecB superfamily